MDKPNLSLPSRQRGIAFWHVLLLVVIAVSLAVCANNRSIPVLQRPLHDFQMPGIPKLSFQNPAPAPPPARPQAASRPETYTVSQPSHNNNPTHNNNVEWILTSGKTTQVQPPPSNSAYELEYPRDLARGYYTVQVLSGYNSKSAYKLRNALQKEGYNAYIHQETTHEGVLFKVRVGKYKNRADAFAMNTKLRLHYPKSIKGSFVLLRQ